MLDWHIPSARIRVIAQAKAFIESGIFDGIMLDEWNDNEPDLIKLLKDVRSAIWNDKLIIVNPNAKKTPNSAPYINGLMMEAGFSSGQYNAFLPPLTPDDWQTISDTLLWAEKNLREPRLNALWTWSVKTPVELNRLRATTTLALAHSNGYVDFGNSGDQPIWDPFWEHKELGKPIDKMTTRPDGAIQREYEGGTVIYNPMGNTAVTITFAGPHLSAASGQTALKFMLEAMDGDLYLKTA
jgi:hypothetical protein